MNCTICAAPLATEREIFGPAYAPVCVVCFLDPAQAICPHCHGLGRDDVHFNICQFCNGEQYVEADALLDWLEFQEE